MKRFFKKQQVSPDKLAKYEELIARGEKLVAELQALEAKAAEPQMKTLTPLERFYSAVIASAMIDAHAGNQQAQAWLDYLDIKLHGDQPVNE